MKMKLFEQRTIWPLFERLIEQFSNNFDTLLGQKFQETIFFVSTLNHTANQFHIEANSKNAESSEEIGVVTGVLKQLNFRTKLVFLTFWPLKLMKYCSVNF